jgi:hypothetical protein
VAIKGASIMQTYARIYLKGKTLDVVKLAGNYYYANNATTTIDFNYKFVSVLDAIKYAKNNLHADLAFAI